MKTKHLLFSLLLILTSVFGANKGFSQIVISGYMANPAGTDGSYEYVQLVATQNIDFSTDPYTVIWCNNSTASPKGWVASGNLTYGFALTSGSVLMGDTFYVGGANKTINGVGSTDISGAIWIRAILTATQTGDGFGNANSGGSLGNGGTADGVAVFNEAVSNIDSSTVPLDVVFFGTAYKSAKPATGGYMLPYNDKYSTYQGTFGNGSDTLFFPDPVSGNFCKLTGTYDLTTNTWTTPRTSSNVVLTATSAISIIAPAITITGTATPAVALNSFATASAYVNQGSLNNPSYHLVCDVVNLPVTLDSIKFKTYGSFNAGDIKNNGFKLWYSSDATFSTSDSLIDSTDATGTGEIWFSNPALTLPGNSTAHFFVTTDLSTTALHGHTIYFDSFMVGDIYFAFATKFGASIQPPGGTLTFISSSVMINSIYTPSANVIQGSVHNPSYHLVCDVITLPATLDSIKFKTYGSFSAADIKSYGFKLWYSADGIFSASDSLIDSIDAIGPGDLLFSNPAFQIPVNTTAHFFVTTDISSYATLGDSIYFDSLMLGNIYFASAQMSGANQQPRSGVLTVTSSSAPIINVSSLNIFSNQVIGSTSAEQMYTVTANNLFPATGDIVVTPPTGFEISLTTGTGFVDSFLTIPYTAGLLNPTEIFVVFKPALITTYSGNITHVGGTASQNLQVTGYGISPDTIAPKVDTAYAVDLNTVIVKFSEVVDTTAEQEQNYVLAGGVTSAIRDASLKVVTLSLAFPLVKGVPKNLTIEDITDTCSNHNKMKPQTFQLFIPAELVLNELLTLSTTIDDFIEVYNPNLTKSISLKGWHLTNDSATNLLKWAFPDTVISAGGYLVVWDNQHPANPGIHCTFGLNNVSGEVVLRNDLNTTIGYTKYPLQKTEISWGRIPNGTGNFAFTKPTPGAVNVLAPKPIPTYTIAQIRTNNGVGEPDSVGVNCKVIGIVYGVNFSAFGYSFTVIDNTGGINMYKSNTTITPPYKVKEGDKIRVIGKIQLTYKGLTEMGIDSIVRLDSNQNLVSPLVVTTLDETTESKLVKLENLTLADVDTALWPKIAGTLAVNVRAYNPANDTFVLRIHFKCDLQGTPRPTTKFNIIGLGNQYDANSPYFEFYELWPRYKADLILLNSIPPVANSLGLELYPNPNNGQFIMDNPSNSRLNISILNSLGQEISSYISTQSRITLNITNGKGLYFVKAVATNGQSSMMKVIVK